MSECSEAEYCARVPGVTEHATKNFIYYDEL